MVKNLADSNSKLQMKEWKGLSSRAVVEDWIRLGVYRIKKDKNPSGDGNLEVLTF